MLAAPRHAAVVEVVSVDLISSCRLVDYDPACALHSDQVVYRWENQHEVQALVTVPVEVETQEAAEGIHLPNDVVSQD